MRNLVLKLHIYAGLLTFSQLMLYGIAGLVATAQTAAERPKVPHAVRYVPFTVRPGTTDRQVADDIYNTLHLPLTRPMPGWFLRRTPESDPARRPQRSLAGPVTTAGHGRCRDGPTGVA